MKKLHLVVLLIMIIMMILKLKILRIIINAYYFKWKNNVKIDSFLPYAFLYNEIFEKKCYDFNIKDGMTILDVGANIGLFNLYVNSKAKNLNVYSFEPVPQLYNYLKNNTSKYKNTICINKGLGYKNETVTINYLKNASGMSSINEFDNDKIKAHDKIYKEYGGIFHNLCKNYVNNQMKNPVKVKCEITTISDIIEKYNITNIDVVKIDVEGFELNVLKGIKSEHFNIIKKIFIEIENFRDSNNKNDILNILNENNFNYKMDDNSEDWLMVEATRRY